MRAGVFWTGLLLPLNNARRRNLYETASSIVIAPVMCLTGDDVSIKRAVYLLGVCVYRGYVVYRPWLDIYRLRCDIYWRWWQEYRVWPIAAMRVKLSLGRSHDEHQSSYYGRNGKELQHVTLLKGWVYVYPIEKNCFCK